MSNVIPFEFDQQQFRVIPDEGGEPWFVATDVARVLGYQSANHIARRLDDDEKGYAEVSTLGGLQHMTIINESGLYHATFKSQKEGAKRFRRWVTSDVLPAVRKTGGYQVKSPAPDPDPETSSKYFKACYEVGALVRRGDHNQAVLAANMATRSKFGIDFLGEMGMEALPAPEGERELLTPSDIGIELGGISGQAVNKSLERLGFQQPAYSAKGKKEWRATDAGFKAGAKLLDTGKKQGNGTPIRQLKWEAGVIDLLKEAGCGFAG